MLYKAPELQAGAQHSHSVPKITAHMHYPAETQLLCSHVPGPHSRGRSHTLSQARKGGVTSSSPTLGHVAAALTAYHSPLDSPPPTRTCPTA